MIPFLVEILNDAYPDFLKQPLRPTPSSRHFASRVPFQRAACFVATVLTIQAGRSARPSPRSPTCRLGSGGESCADRLGLNRSAPLAAAKQSAHGTLVEFGGTTFVFLRSRRPATARSRSASRAPHPPSAARYGVGGIPPSLPRLHLPARDADRPRVSRSCGPPRSRSRLTQRLDRLCQKAFHSRLILRF